FPVERYTKGGIGMANAYAAPKDKVTYSKLPDEEVMSRIPCDLKDHPLLMIPIAERRSFLERLLGKSKADEIWPNLSHYIKTGDLCHRCKQIFEALLTANNGDFKKVLMH